MRFNTFFMRFKLLQMGSKDSKCRHIRAAFRLHCWKQLLLLLALALLICNAAAGLACGLAGSLALAAAALLCAFAKIAGLNRLDVTHDSFPPSVGMSAQ